MTKIYSRTLPLSVDVLDAFCALQKGFTDQFVYYRKDAPVRYLGLGRCVALASIQDAEYIEDEAFPSANAQLAADVACPAAPDKRPALPEARTALHGERFAMHDKQASKPDACVNASSANAGQSPLSVKIAPVFFYFGRFDAENPAPLDEMSASFPRLQYLLPEAVLIEREEGVFLQVNSLGPVYPGRVARFVRMCEGASPPQQKHIEFELYPDSFGEWRDMLAAAGSAIEKGRIKKVVVSRRQSLQAREVFSSKDLLVNLVKSPARGTVLMYRYADVFFLACTPELLVRKRGAAVESMCLAGTVRCGNTEEESCRLAEGLLHDDKNLREHAFVVSHVREVLERMCYGVEIPAAPGILQLQHVQHLHTPVRAQVFGGLCLADIVQSLQPTPAVAGAPVGEARMLIRELEKYNRGFFASACGFVDAFGDGEFSVALRSGIFDGERGYIFAGCGIVKGSNAEDEFEETSLKMQTILSAFA